MPCSDRLTQSVSIRIQLSPAEPKLKMCPTPAGNSANLRNPTTEFARCFLRLANLPNYALRPPQPI